MKEHPFKLQILLLNLTEESQQIDADKELCNSPAIWFLFSRKNCVESDPDEWYLCRFPCLVLYDRQNNLQNRQPE